MGALGCPILGIFPDVSKRSHRKRWRAGQRRALPCDRASGWCMIPGDAPALLPISLPSRSDTRRRRPRSRREILRWGLPHCPEPRATETCDCDYVARIRLRRYRDALGKNNSAARPPNVARFASSLLARGRTQRPLPALRDRQPAVAR
jgi:hypothetical protein